MHIGVTRQPYVRYDAETRELVVDETRNRKQIDKEVVLGARETACASSTSNRRACWISCSRAW